MWVAVSPVRVWIAVRHVVMLRRPWPPVYRHRPSFNYSVQQHEWREFYTPFAREKCRDYYLLAPLYRNALPPPPPRLPLNMPPRCLLTQSRTDCTYQCVHNACHCFRRNRSRSLDNVRSDEEDVHYCTRITQNLGKENYLKRRSMENLLDQRSAGKEWVRNCFKLNFLSFLEILFLFIVETSCKTKKDKKQIF